MNLLVTIVNNGYVRARDKTPPPAPASALAAE